MLLTYRVSFYDWPNGCVSNCYGERPIIIICVVSQLKLTLQTLFDSVSGVYALPSPPTNVKVTPISASEAEATWDPPKKNPDSVELYRVLWRETGNR